MAVEQLLKPRYKVIAGYPCSELKIGGILEWNDKLDSFCFNENGKDYWYDRHIEKYPHLFKKLEWWEERKESDMPEYVKWKHLNQVFLLSDLNSVNQPHLLSVTLPATKEEYENQKTIE